MSGFWYQCSERLQDELSAQQFNTWIRPLQAKEAEQSLTLLAPNRFVVDWVRERFFQRIETLLQEVSGGHPPDLLIEIGSVDAAPKLQAANEKPVVTATQNSASHNAAPALNVVKPKPDIFYKTNINREFNFSTFVEGKSNQLAKAASMQVAENPGRAYNPLFLYGGVGLGKTHLMHAVGNLILQHKQDAKVVYLHSERFVADMVKALQSNAINEFKRHYRSVDALLIDDIQFFAGKERSPLFIADRNPARGQVRKNIPSKALNLDLTQAAECAAFYL